MSFNTQPETPMRAGGPTAVTPPCGASPPLMSVAGCETVDSSGRVGALFFHEAACAVLCDAALTSVAAAGAGVEAAP